MTAPPSADPSGLPSAQAYLLDSHVLLWWWFLPERLSEAVQALLADPSSSLRVSAASVWELSIKHHRGQLPELSTAIGDLEGLLRADGFENLAITHAHGLRAGGFSQVHRDPFDRMLAAQAELERLVLLTADPALSTFPCRTLW
jgi:PIN domain nuclease of toxin-antitoxin system